jgi:hypothetical protein
MTGEIVSYLEFINYAQAIKKKLFTLVVFSLFFFLATIPSFVCMRVCV